MSGSMDRKQTVENASENLKKDATKNAKHIRYESFGADKNKKKKNEHACDRGTSTGPARYCSAHIRQIYPADILGDNGVSEYCVNGRHTEECCMDNDCKLCSINIQDYHQPPAINLSQALCSALKGNPDDSDRDSLNDRLLSFLYSHIIENYPGTKSEETKLRIKVNGAIWVDYFIKLAQFSSLLKTSAPSGYKYKDRMSIGRMIKIQGNSNKDLVFYLTKDQRYNDPEKEDTRPVVNCVGFWNLLKAAKPNEIRNIIHLNVDQVVNVSFGFLIKNPSNVKSIEVDLVTKRQWAGLKEKVISLWKYPNHVPAPQKPPYPSNRSMSPPNTTSTTTPPSQSYPLGNGTNSSPHSSHSNSSLAQSEEFKNGDFSLSQDDTSAHSSHSHSSLPPHNHHQDRYSIPTTPFPNIPYQQPQQQYEFIPTPYRQYQAPNPFMQHQNPNTLLPPIPDSNHYQEPQFNNVNYLPPIPQHPAHAIYQNFDIGSDVNNDFDTQSMLGYSAVHGNIFNPSQEIRLGRYSPYNPSPNTFPHTLQSQYS